MLLLLVEDSFQLRCVVKKSEVLSRILVCALLLHDYETTDGLSTLLRFMAGMVAFVFC